MLNLPTHTRVYLCAAPVDLRKSFDGLSGLVESVFQEGTKTPTFCPNWRAGVSVVAHAT
jgi:hypothetical protein